MMKTVRGESNEDDDTWVSDSTSTPTSQDDDEPTATDTEAADGDGGNPVAAGAAGAAAGAAGAVVGVPAAVSAMGFTAEGIAAGSTAAAMMSAEAIASGTGGVAAGGLVSTLQSVGAVGLGVGATALVAVTGAALGGAAVIGGVRLIKAFHGRHDCHRYPGCGQISDISAVRPGNVIALHSPVFNRFIRVMGEDVDGFGGKKNLEELPSNWGSERLTVVDAGNGQIALYSACHRCFIRLYIKDVDARGGVIDMNDLPPEDVWGSERFTIVDAGDGKIALYSKCHDRLVRMNEWGGVDANGRLGIKDLPYDGAWEAFSVLLLDE